MDDIFISWFGEPAKKAISSVFNDLNSTTEALDIFRKYRKKHFSSLRNMMRILKVLGMTKPVPLESIYSPAYVSTTVHRRLYEMDWRSFKTVVSTVDIKDIRNLRKEKTLRADVFVDEHSRVVILGGPGSGKTTFLRHLGLSYSSKSVFKKTKLKKSYCPFYVSMLRYIESEKDRGSIFDYIVENLRQKTDDNAEYFIKRVLTKGLAVVLLDALDEVPSKSRKVARERVLELCERFTNCRVVISCRTADYTVPFEEFYEVEMSRLTDSARRKIIRAWFGNDTTTANKLIRRLGNEEGLSCLTETPLLLSLLCIQFRHDLDLPKRRTELYKRCVEAFLRDWDTSKGFRRDSDYSDLDDTRKERIFESVAGRFSGESLQYLFRGDAIVKEISKCCELFGIEKEKAPDILDEIERHHGIIEMFSAGIYAFSHQSFQDYFASKHFIAERKEYAVVKNNYDSLRWFPVLEFIVAMHNNPEKILRFLVNKSNMSELRNYPAMAKRTRQLWLLYRCMTMKPAATEDLRKSIYRHIACSQIEMSRIYEGGGVFPISVLVEDGVKHAYFYQNRRRQTLGKALQPLRRLANEILLSPCQSYAEEAMSAYKNLNEEPTMGGSDSIEFIKLQARKLCLITPLASIFPKFVNSELDSILDSGGPDFLLHVVSESKGILSDMYMNR